MDILKTKLLAECKCNATINYSMIKKFKPAYIYRFFCLSLFRDEWYNARIKLDELKAMTGDKSLSNFNTTFKEFLDIKPYYIERGFIYKTRRNVYHIPPKELKYITLSKDFVNIDLDCKYKGFFIQLILLSKFTDIELTKPNIIKELGIDRKTYDKYVKELLGNLLIYDGDRLVLLTDGILLKNEIKGQKILSKRERGGSELPNITLSPKKNK
jgi:hypothetical protein